MYGRPMEPMERRDAQVLAQCLGSTTSDTPIVLASLISKKHGELFAIRKLIKNDTFNLMEYTQHFANALEK